MPALTAAQALHVTYVHMALRLWSRRMTIGTQQELFDVIGIDGLLRTAMHYRWNFPGDNLDFVFPIRDSMLRLSVHRLVAIFSGLYCNEC